MWRVTRYLFAFASGQAFEAWLSQKLERPNYASAGQKLGAKIDAAAERLARYLEERDA